MSDHKPLRVASLLPSATEMVSAVGCEADLVGVSHECDWPPSVVGRRILTSARLSPLRTSAEIDRDVREVLRDALAVYDIDETALGAVAPDVIVTQDLCDVCAVSFDDVVAAARRVAHPDVKIVNLHPTRLAHIWDDLRKVGAALGRSQEADAACAAMDARVAAVGERAAQAASLSGKPAVLTVEWIDPIMVGGTWMPELVELAGGRALVTAPGDHAPTLTREQLVALDPAPDVVVVKPCGFKLERTREELHVLRDLLSDMPWPAVAARRVWIADGNAFFNRPGPRIVDSLEIMAACVHPDAFGDLAVRHAGAFELLGISAQTTG